MNVTRLGRAQWPRNKVTREYKPLISWLNDQAERSPFLASPCPFLNEFELPPPSPLIKRTMDVSLYVCIIAIISVPPSIKLGRHVIVQRLIATDKFLRSRSNVIA